MIKGTGFYDAVKRLADIFLSIIGLAVLWPLMLFAALGIKLTSAGPIIFRQRRIGKDMRPFVIYKFRSMRCDDEQSDTVWVKQNDSRRTKFGAFLRKFSIDELPQLINVIKGDMSLVGPRPERPYFVERFCEHFPDYSLRHSVRPGMTGWAQINGWRGDTSIEERLKCDLYYIEHRSLSLDIKILLLTPFSGLINHSEKL